MLLLRQACESISDGLGKTASALVRTPLKRYQRGAGAGSAIASAVQAAPAAASVPASATARALHYALLGVRNRLDSLSLCARACVHVGVYAMLPSYPSA